MHKALPLVGSAFFYCSSALTVAGIMDLALQALKQDAETYAKGIRYPHGGP